MPSPPLPPPRRVLIREQLEPEAQRPRSSLRTLFDARLRGRWAFVLPVLWLAAAGVTWYLLH